LFLFFRIPHKNVQKTLFMEMLLLQVDDSTWLEFCRCFGVTDVGLGTYSASYSGGYFAAALARLGPRRQLSITDYTLDWIVLHGFAVGGDGQLHDNVDCLHSAGTPPNLRFGNPTCAFCVQMELDALQVDLEFLCSDYDSYTMRRAVLKDVYNKLT
jgi:hypothetical protein